jgi:hypothetical protein
VERTERSLSCREIGGNGIVCSVRVRACVVCEDGRWVTDVAGIRNGL